MHGCRSHRFDARVFLVAATAVACTIAHAEGQNVHRCIGAQGEIVFSGLPCGTPIAADPKNATSSASTGAKTAPVNCPESVENLRDLIAQALSQRDANAIAGVMRWDGVGGAAARQRMQEIAELAARPMIGIDTAGGALALDEPAPVETPESEQAAPRGAETATSLIVRTGSSEFGGPREHEFTVVRSDGCYWLDW